MRAARDERGQASVELVALLPLIALIALVCWQAVVVGQAIWLSGAAARGAARAEAGGADAEAGARAALPPARERGLRVRTAREGVRVVVAVPSVVGGWRLGGVTASARFPSQSR